MSKSANGRSSIHRDASGIGWHGWVSFPANPVTGKPVRKHVRGKTKAEVAAKVKKLEDARESGYTALSQDATLAEYLRWWIEMRRHSVKPKTVAGYETDLRNYVAPSAIGRTKLSKLTAEHVDLLFSEVRSMPSKRRSKERLSQNTLAHLWRTLRAALQYATEKGRLPRNPLDAADKVRAQRVEIMPFYEDEVRQILRCARLRRNGARWGLALETGIRQGEALGLQRDNFDLDQGVMALRRQLQRRTWQHGCDDPEECVRPVATRRCAAGTRRRAADCPQRHSGGLTLLSRKGHDDGDTHTVALSPGLVEILRAHFRSQAAERLAAGPLWDAAQPQWVFATETGRPIDPRADYGEWCALLRSAGLRHARLHDARHSMATLHLANNTAPRVLQEMVGWSSMALLERYQHPVDEMKRQAANRLGSQLFADL